jgi:hypothetical protein
MLTVIDNEIELQTILPVITDRSFVSGLLHVNTFKSPHELHQIIQHYLNQNNTTMKYMFEPRDCTFYVNGYNNHKLLCERFEIGMYYCKNDPENQVAITFVTTIKNSTVEDYCRQCFRDLQRLF